MTRRHSALVGALAAGTLGTALLTPPAQAAPQTPAVARLSTITLATATVLYQGSRLCYEVPVRYSVPVPGDAAAWSLEIEGRTASGATTFNRVSKGASDATGSPTAGTVAVRLCPTTHKAGPITFTASGSYYTAGYGSQVTWDPVSISATIAKSESRVAFRMGKTAAAYRERVPFRAKVTQQLTRMDGTTGWGPAADVKVVLQERVGTRWRRVGIGYANSLGVWRNAVIMGRPSSGTFRVKVPGSTVRGSLSASRSVQ